MSAINPRFAEAHAFDAPHMTALRALFLLAVHHGVTLGPHDLPQLAEPDFAPALIDTLGRLGFRSRLMTQASWSQAASLGSAYPVLAERRDGRWVILVQVVGSGAEARAAVLDPATEAEGIRLIERAAFEQDWSGKLLLARRGSDQAAALTPFGLRWFLPALSAQRGLLAGVAVSVILGNLIGFSLPLLFQIIIDKVISHQAWNTLLAVVCVFMLLVGFDAGFTYVRHRLMQVAGGKIDAQIGTRAFGQLLGLPLSVFETTASGVLVRNMQLAENVRQFLTGKLFQTLLDAALLPVLLTLLALLSGQLTLVVLLFACAMAAVIGLLLPMMRRRLDRLYAAEAARQSHLVETLRNMHAVKALVLEPARRRIWDAELAASVARQWDVGQIGALASAVTGLLERLMQVAVIGLGAMLVMQGVITTGTLVAFLMLAGRVTGPLVQIVGLISEWQEAALSIRLLRGVLDRPPERGTVIRPLRPQLTGQVSLSQVSFTFAGAERPTLDRIDISLPAGSMIGIVGRSGSGKTTLTRLIQGIETPQSGTILFDGHDIRHIDLDHLRRSLGVVLQENLLFRGTVRENIAIARPQAGIEEITAAARLAGADEFIRKLAGGYETMVQEGGANLSGGQRQRIAIARALLTSPPLLILDEATSSLDPESEAIVNRNLAAIARGRSVIIVSHRLSSLVRADAIVVMDGGRVVDMAPHATLVARCDIYRQLWLQQTEHLA